MKIKIHYTGSKGNLYSIDNGKDKLLIECGIPIKKINKAVEFKLSDYSGCLCSHEHLDHSLSVPDLINRGVDVYAIKEVFESHSIDSPFAHVIEPKKAFKIGSYTIIAFPVEHDVPNVGFLISDGINKIIFATDCYKIVNRFKGLTHIMIECNYDKDVLESNEKAGLIHPVVRQRVVNSHIELWQTQEFLKHNISESTKEVYLIHESKSNL